MAITRRVWHWAGLITMILLMLISIPWYRTGLESTQLFGLPGWVITALVCYSLIALINALLWLSSEKDKHRESD